MKRLKIIAIIHYYATNNRGGGEIMIHNILRHLAKTHDVTAIAMDNKGPTMVVDGVKVYHGSQPNFDYSGYDLVITHFGRSPDAAKVARKYKRPLVLLVHNTLNPDYSGITQKPDFIIYNTNWVRNHWLAKGVKIPSLVVHPPVFGDEHRVERTGENITLINLIPAKGSFLFYQLAMFMPQWKFLGVEGGYYKSKQQYPRLMRNVTFQQNTDDMKRDVWSKTRILLMPSSYESYGMAALEAMHSGIPVIAYPTPGLVEALGDAGIFVDNFSTTPWYKTIRALHKEDAYKEQSDKVRKYAQTVDPVPELDKLVKVLEELCNARIKLGE